MSFGRRIARIIPAEIWALLLIALPMALVALERIETIHTAPHQISGPNDPDSWLRLTLVRAWMQGGDWYDHRITRSNAPDGTTTPWTRPLDGVIATLVKAQPGDAPLDTKLLLAASALPVLWMVILMLGLFRGAQHLNPTPLTYLMLAALVGATPILWSYFGQGNADHHAMLAALWAWVLADSLAPSAQPRHAWRQGTLLALMLWISPEALLLIALVYGWPLLRWLADGRPLRPLAQLTGATAGVSLLALLVERGPDHWLTPIYDSLSIVHVVLLWLCALVVAMLMGLPARWRARRATRLLAAKIGGTALLVTMGLLYPKFFSGPMAEVSPFIFDEFLPRIHEAKPLLAKPPMVAASLLVLPALAALLYGVMLRVRQPLLPRATTLQLLLFLAVTLALVLVQIRWYYYLFPLVALMLAPLVGALADEDARWPARIALRFSPIPRMLVRLAAILFVVATPLILFSASPAPLSPQGKTISACERAARYAIRSGALEQALGPAPLTLYAPTNLGAEILFHTPYHIIASNYHREGEAIRYVWHATRIPDEAALKAYLAERKVTALLLCPDGRAPTNSLLMRLHAGTRAFSWLHPVATIPGFSLWTVRTFPRHPIPE